MDFKTGLKVAGVTALAIIPSAVGFGVFGAMKDRNKGNVASGLAASASGLGAGVVLALGSAALGLWELPQASSEGTAGMGLLNVTKSMGLLNVQRKRMGLIDVQRRGMGLVNVQRMRGCSTC